ncbi:MAG: exosortase-associated EpsI family protein [Akkermansia sp.]|nr:exosortase-associated EpsI family protein [Akkermansia sp.]
MKLKDIITIALPPAVLGLILSIIFLLPVDVNLLPSAISPELPYDYELPGWYGEKTQETERERSILAADTVFSKALYKRQSLDLSSSSRYNSSALQKNEPSISVSIVYSGSDLNNSIHRPERCLPAQGHLDLRSSDHSFELSNGKKITCRRLDSITLTENKAEQPLQHIHYYVFIGHDRITHSHLARTFYDMWDRVMIGKTQSWGYLQVGSYWGGPTYITEEEADTALREIIKELSVRQIDWTAIKK